MSVFLRRDNTNIQDYLKVINNIDSGLSDHPKLSGETQVHPHPAYENFGNERIQR